MIVIGHSHLRDRFLGYPRQQAIRGRLLMTSAGTLHVAHEAPLKVFAVAELSDCTLRVAGKIPASLAESFARTLGDHPHTVSIRDELLSDAERVMEISRAEVVVVAAPHTYDGQNTMILALSLDRPVLVEDTLATRQWAAEIGHDWVRLHSGRLTAQSLGTAIESLRSAPPAGRPDLGARDPNTVLAQYADAFRAAVRLR